VSVLPKRIRQRLAPGRSMTVQEAYERSLPEFVYPVHGWSASVLGPPSTPLTWFTCKGCGSERLGTPYSEPSLGCLTCLFEHPRRLEPDWQGAGWEVSDAASALAATVAACDGNDGFVRRVTDRAGT
jgi:hypothetical protein